MDTVQKFQELLKELFQFETSDLDFGVYRILNYKREQIARFIEKDLVHKVESAFARHKDERLANIDQQFAEVREELLDTARKLGKEPLTAAGELKEEFRDSELGRKYHTLKAQKDEAEMVDEIKLQVFNDLYSFFSRFYEEGDFVPQYRYSIKGHKYAIPYNGEEVKLYWANNEQYYTKTGLLFRDYTFKAKDCKIVFHIVSAREELGSKKATKERFFVLDDENPIELIPSPLMGEGKGEGEGGVKGRTLIIRFQYRELTEEEVKSYGVEGGNNTSKQEKMNHANHLEVLPKIEDSELKTRLGENYRNEKPLLHYQLSRFAARNTKDYFIHKNLKRFLSEQLDYFIKAEVLSIDTLEKERFLDKHITRAKVVREIGQDIIDFLSQIEDFQKRLWEKKKFVLKTEYVITTDRVPEEFYDEIWNNEEQREEWTELGLTVPSLASLRGTKSRSNLHLPIDTRYFTQEFKEKLLEKLTQNADLDDLLDGLLIKSENYQALNLLLGKYKEKVQTIYIDPPFNLGTNANFLYNVNYKDSSWISILENRLRLARYLLGDRGSIFVRCDYNGNMYVRLLLNEVFGEENFTNELVVNRISKKGFAVRETFLPNKYPVSSDTVYFWAKSGSATFNLVRIYKKANKEKWHALDVMDVNPEMPKPRIILGKEMLAQSGRKWMFSQEKIYEMEKQGLIKLNARGKPVYKVKSQDYEALDSNWTDVPGYSSGWDFKTENSEILLKRVIESTSNEGDLVMDFFLGSSTTTAVAHKLKRKWIGVELGEHFWTVVLPRMKKVLAYDKSGISKEKDIKEIYNENTAGGFFKYQILEQYEDTLDNIELTSNKQAELKFGDDYLLKYFLDYETRESPHLLNIDQLKTPLCYKLKVNLEEVGEPQEMVMDIPETFNYLLGLKVKKVKTRNNQGQYLFILGEKAGKNMAIVWRDYEDKWTEDDFKEDKEFIIKELEPWAPHIVYVNGQSVLTPKLGDLTVEIRHIEPEFKKLMS